MRKRVFKKSMFSVIAGGMAYSLVTVSVVVAVMYGLRQTERSADAEGLRSLETGIRRAIVACYAIEGFYPDSISYIETNYGVHIDRSRYAVHYEIFASNIIPVVTVTEKQRILSDG